MQSFRMPSILADGQRYTDGAWSMPRVDSTPYQLLNLWINSGVCAVSTVAEFDDKYRSLTLVQDAGQARRDWRTGMSRASLTTVCKILGFEALGLSVNEFWRGPTTFKHANVLEWGSRPRFRSRAVPSTILRRCRSEVFVGPLFWPAITHLSQSPVSYLDSGEFLGMSHSLLKATPDRLEVGQLVSISTFLDVSPFALPIPNEASRIASSILKDLRWIPDPSGGRLHNWFRQESRHLELLKLCDMRRGLDSSTYLRSLSNSEQREIAGRVYADSKVLSDELKAKNREVSITVHVALHMHHYPRDESRIGRELLHGLFEKITDVAIDSDQVQRLWAAQHELLSSILYARDGFNLDQLDDWFLKENALCWACCIIARPGWRKEAS
ncbi:MAG: hypothetical protein ACK52I_10740 [Pseudomonadota bacterium]